MINSKPIRAAFELKKLRAFLFHLLYPTLNLSKRFVCSKQALLERKLWDTPYLEGLFQDCMHKKLDIYGHFGPDSRLIRAISRSTDRAMLLQKLETKRKGVPAEVWTMIRLSGTKMEFIPKMIDYFHFSEGHFLALQYEPLYNYTLKAAIEYGFTF